MKIKEQNKLGILKILPIVRNHKLLFGIFAILTYGVAMFLLGGVEYKKGIFGKILKPIYEEHVRIPINYVRSLILAKPEHIYLDISYKDFQKLAYKREIALRNGVLHSSKKDFVPAKIRWKNTVLKARVRLKGDLADHWSDEEEWSFRVKIKGDRTVMGMREFSLQHPRTRGFLNDWYLHQLLRYIGGFIVLRYKFVDLALNGKDLGIYLLEEHFDKMLLKNNGYLDAPIVRMYDHLLWYNVDPKIGFSKRHLNENFTLSPIDSFNTGSVIRSEKLSREYSQAKNLLEAFRHGKLATHDVFDSGKLARLFAVIDLLGYHHSTAYSNIRFYYNPITSKLEPIGYDNTFIMSAASIQGDSKRIQLFNDDSFHCSNPDIYEMWYQNFFRDRVFFEEYIRALDMISRKAFLDKFFEKTDGDANKMLNILHRTFPGYRFKYKDTLYRNQEFIRERLNPSFPVLNAYLYCVESNNIVLELGNVHTLPLEIVSASCEGHEIYTVDKEVILQAKIPLEFVNYKRIRFRIPENLTWSKELKTDIVVKYKVLGTNYVKRVKVSPWSHFDEEFPKKTFTGATPPQINFPFIVRSKGGKKIEIKTGEWRLEKDLIIPRGYHVVCFGNTRLILTGSARIISYSPFDFNGRKDAPIVIEGQGDNPQGIVLMNTDKQSIFRFTIFRNLGICTKGDWASPGALVLYQAPVRVQNCKFQKSRGADFLVLIRSTFAVQSCTFEDCDGIGLNALYSTGSITETSFARCQKQGIIGLGSDIRCKKIRLDRCLGGGIIASERSVIRVVECTIKGCSPGVESNSESKVYVKGVRIGDYSLDFRARRKNPEFTYAFLSAEHVRCEDGELAYECDRGSVLFLEGKRQLPNI